MHTPNVSNFVSIDALSYHPRAASHAKTHIVDFKFD